MEIIGLLRTGTFDLVVIGGGITGAGIALDAASRGMKVALVEMRDFASGTSSKSTKLVHGGLRYLKQLEIGLVREVGRERAIVHHLAPHLVVAEKMLLPLIEGGKYGKLATSFALLVYDFLADVEDEDKRRMLTKEETLAQEPLLREDILTGGGLYAEYRTDDARLTIEIIKTAAKHGALSLNYVRAEEFLYENKKVVGIRCKDLPTEEVLEIRSTYVVSAAGPWVDQLRKKNNSLKGKHLFHSKGVHLVVPHERLPVHQAVYFDVPDGRMMFAIPRHRVTYLGTTDTPYEGDLNHVFGTKEDASYILDAVNNMFPKANLTLNDVESSWAGLRPLIFEEGKSAGEMSRKDEVFESDTGLISIAGGKLTGYRKMAERVVDLVCKKFYHEHKKEFPECFTDKIPLTGGPFDNEEAVLSYQKEIEKKGADFKDANNFASYLVANYGRQTEAILAKAKSFTSDSQTALVRAELGHCLQNELTLTPLDFFLRRSGRLYFNIGSIPPVLDTVLEGFKNYFSWEKERVQKEKELVLKAMRAAAIQ